MFGKKPPLCVGKVRSECKETRRWSGVVWESTEILTKKPRILPKFGSSTLLCGLFEK